MPNIDFQYDTDGDILFDEVNQDIAIGPADADNVADLIEIIPGQLRTSPISGWAAKAKLNGEVTQEDIADLHQQLANDGYPNLTITIIDGQMNIVNNTPNS